MSALAKDLPTARHRVLLVDDHPVVREGLAKRINAEADLMVCAEAESAAQALQRVQQCQPDVIVVDLALSKSHGLDLIKEIRAQHCQTPILVFTMFDETTYALRSVKAGAQGYLTKGESSDRLLSAIRSVLAGDYALSPQISRMFFESSLKRSAAVTALPHVLADRELQVLELMGKGAGTRQIATQLGRSVKTIETYQGRIKRKLNLASATELMREAVRWVETRRQ
jgi:DNA-binding NarL/FixJ family response regulator